MQRNKIKKLVTLGQTRFLNFYEAIYKNKEGKEKSWFMVSRKPEEVIRKQCFEGQEDTTDAVLIVATHKPTGKLVLIRQFRVPLNDYIYELPAGLIDQGEDSSVSVKRELKEETGLDLIEIQEEKSIEKAYLSPGMTDESVALIYCTCEGTLAKSFMEADEEIEPMLISKEEARQILISKQKIDIKAYIILSHYCQPDENSYQ